MQNSRLEQIDIDAWRAAIRQDTFANYHYKMGVALENSGSAEAALAAYERAIAEKPTHGPSHWCLLALLERSGGAQPEAVRDRARRLCPDYQDQWTEEQAAAAIAENRLEEAVKLLGNLGRPSVQAAGLWAELAKLYRRQSRFEEAASFADTALDGFPDLSEAHREKGLLLRAQGKLSEAFRSLEIAAATFPFDLEVVGNLAFCHLAFLRFDASFAITERHCKQPVPDLFLNLVHGIGLHVLGRYGEAAGFIRSLPQMQETSHPDYWWLVCYEGLSLQAMGRVRDALDRYERGFAACLDEYKPMVCSYLGLGLEAAGDLPGALARHETATGGEAVNAWMLGNHALTLLAMGRQAEADALLVRSLSCGDTPNIPLEVHQRPWAQARLKDAYARLRASGVAMPDMLEGWLAQ